MAKYSIMRPGNPGKAGTSGKPGKSLTEVICAQENNGVSSQHLRGAIAKRSSSGGLQVNAAGNAANSSPRITLRHGEERGIVCYVFQVTRVT